IDAVYASLGAGAEAILPMYRDTADAKPSPALLHRAAKELHLDLTRSWFVGDTTRDIEAASHAGCRGVLVRTGLGASNEQNTLARFPETPVLDDLPAAVGHILSAR
ncbi:MAG TPA: D,D-heptose 1,7-bisphosphate phosphatase, partial [Phycisphaerales bacterium]|nr:D,D-heptose 1,7-bisphosphate phosphatase [Phycisphaerales bacterium]